MNKTTQFKYQETDLNRDISKEKNHMAEKHLKKCSVSFAINDLKIKTTLRFHIALIRIAKTNKRSDSL